MQEQKAEGCIFYPLYNNLFAVVQPKRLPEEVNDANESQEVLLPRMT